MEELLDKVKPFFQKYDEGKEYVTVDKAKKIIEEMEENGDESFKTVFKTMNFPGNKVKAIDIAYWIDSKNKGTGHLAMVPIYGYRSIEKAKEMMEKYGFEISSSGAGQNIEAQVEINVSELQVKETQFGIQVSVGGKEHEIMQELGIPQGFAIVFKIKCKDPYSAATKIDELISQAKEILTNMVPPQIAELIEKLEIKSSSVSNDYVAVSIQFPYDHITEIAKQQKELASSFMGDADNQLTINFQMASSMDFKKFQEDKEKNMGDVLLKQDSAWKALFKVLVPGAFASNAKKFSSMLLEKFFAAKLNKYKKLINILTPIFLLQSVGLEINFNSFGNLLEKQGEDSEVLDFLQDFGIDKTPKDFKEDLNDEFQIKETLDGIVEGMPLVQELIEFFKEGVCFDFELLVQIGIVKISLDAKSQGIKEWFEYFMQPDEE